LKIKNRTPCVRYIKEKTMKQILFDLDGTLTDSGEGIMHCAELTLAHYGLPIPNRSEMRSIVGPPLKDSFRRFGITETELENAIAFYRKHYLAVGQFENYPYPGIQSLLEKLKAAGHKLYVATSKPETMAQNILAYFGLAKYFDQICGADSDRNRNKKEDVIEYLLSGLTDQEELIMVGDTIFDVTGAACHGIPTVAVSWGYGIVEDMQASGARIANTMDELYDALR
jgi:phosphoglycolate phosphatase